LGYGEDLAAIHDAEFGFLARAAAATLIEALERSGARSGRIIDLGCGSGVLSEKLAKAGYDVLGLDASSAMLKIARRRVPRGTFRKGWLRSAALPPAVGVAAVGECFNYLFDGNVADGVLSRLFRKVRRALPQGAPFLLDLAAPGRGGESGRVRAHWEGPGWALLMNAEEDRERKLLVRRITTFRRAGARYRRGEEVHRLKLVPPERATELLERAAFRVRRLRGYGDFRFPPGLVGYLCSAR
jgi:SAM-dependent methyltransferase